MNHKRYYDVQFKAMLVYWNWNVVKANRFYMFQALLIIKNYREKHIIQQKNMQQFPNAYHWSSDASLPFAQRCAILDIIVRNFRTKTPAWGLNPLGLEWISIEVI